MEPDPSPGPGIPAVPDDDGGGDPSRPADELRRIAGLAPEERAARLSELVDRLEKDLEETSDLAAEAPADPEG